MKDMATYALDKLTKLGADKASVKITSGRKDEFNVEASKFSLMRTLFEDSLNLKAIIGGKKGTISVNKLDRESVDKAVEECIAMANSATPDEAEDIAPLVENKSFSRTIGGANMGKLFSRSKEILDDVKREYPNISLDLMTLFQDEKTIYLNSNGVEFTDETEGYHVQTTFTAKEGEASSSMNYYGVTVDSLDKPFLDLGMTRTLIDEASRSIKTRMVDDKFVGKIIVTPSCDDMIWYTIFGCFLNFGSILEGTSRWKDSLGKQVADKKLTMSAVPLNPSVIGGERFTDDGFISADFDYIKDGVLKNFALPLYAANKTGHPRSGNTAFFNLEVAAGDVALQDMIKGIDKGLLINRFSGGMPGPSGDVSGVAKNSFLIENGKITDAVSETMVNFNVIDILQNIPAISRERVETGSTIVPWCCFDGVTVSGK